MNFDKKREQDHCLMGLASILLKKPISWLSLLSLPFLHIFGLSFLHLFLTSAALLFSSFFFPISLNPPSSQSSKQDQEEESYVTSENITNKSEKDLETTNEEDEDGVIPDDESLIELSLPSGHYLGHQCTINKKNIYIHNIVQDFRLFELFTEFNDFMEEDNLIEIDITIGSIKFKV